jgi:phospholipase/lecithinase/hemolysin
MSRAAGGPTRRSRSGSPAFAVSSGPGYATRGATTGNGYSPLPGFSTLFALQFQPVANIARVVEALLGAGAQNVQVFNQGPLGETPLARLQGLPGVTGLAEDFNTFLAALPVPAGATLYQVAVFRLFEQVQADPAAYGDQDMVNPAFLHLGEGVDPNQFLFWDYWPRRSAV